MPMSVRGRSLWIKYYGWIKGVGYVVKGATTEERRLGFVAICH